MAEQDDEFRRPSMTDFLKRCVVAGGTLALGRFVTGCAKVPTTSTP